jgi:GntR family transcriptional repressor for pyruvate dehydrogenase complex
MTEQAIIALEHIVLEERQAGDSVPSEAELVERLGVSRLTVREATRALEARGLIEVSKGRRPRVREPNGSLVGDFFRVAIVRDANALLELTEIRQALEVQAAELAAGRASRAQIASMQAAIDQMAAGIDDEETFGTADVQFHESLADATGNNLLSTLIEQLAGPLRVSRSYSYRGRQSRGESFDAVVAAHQTVLNSVADHDPDGAARAMRRHLRTTQRDLKASLRERVPAPIEQQQP